VEPARRRELALAAARARDGAQIGLAVAPPIREGLTVGQLVEPKALPTARAFDEGIREVLDVPGGLPDPRVHEDRGVEPDDVVALADHRPPPGVLHVVLQLHAERAEVPRRARAPVDLARGEDE